MAQKLATAFVEILVGNKNLKRQFGTARNIVNEEVNKLQDVLGRFGLAFGGGLALKSVVGLASTAEQTAVAFNNIIGDLKVTKQLLADLEKFSVTTPFEPGEVRQAGRDLLIFKTAVEDIPETLRFLGDAASGASANLSDVVLVFNQIKGVGKLLTQDFRQLAMRGINLGDELQKILGVTSAEFVKLRETGKISFDQVVQAFKAMTSEGGIFFDAMAAQSRTFAGLMSTLKGNMKILGEAIGKVLIPPLKIIEKLAIKFTNILRSLDGVLGGTLSRVVALAGAVAGLVIVVKGLTIAIIALRGVMLAMIATNPLLAATLITLGLLAAAIITIVSLVQKMIGIFMELSAIQPALKLFNKTWTNISETFSRAFGAIGKVGKAIADLINQIADTEFEGLLDILTSIAVELVKPFLEFTNNLSRLFKFVADSFSQLVENISGALQILRLRFEGAFNAITKAIEGARQAVITILKELHPVIQLLELINAFVPKGTADKAAGGVAGAAAGGGGKGGITQGFSALTELSRKMQEAFLKTGGPADKTNRLLGLGNNQRLRQEALLEQLVDNTSQGGLLVATA